MVAGSMDVNVMAQEEQATSACLGGLRVLECVAGVAGAFCGRLLAGLGADIVKVEPPGTGDVTRRWGPFAGDVPDPERSLLYLHLNLNKRGITLNTATLSGRRLLRRLAADADVLLLADDEPRLPAEEISAIEEQNPRLVVSVVRPFGMSGPYADYRAEDLNLYQAGGDGYLNPSGLAYNLHPNRQPLKLAGYAGDEYCGLAAAVGILSAVYARPRAGGQRVELSKQEAHASISREQIMWWANDGSYETRATHQFAFGGCIPCKDGYVEVYAFAEHQWQALIEIMGNPDWSQAERFQQMENAAAFGPEVQQHLFAWAANLTKDEIYRAAQRAGAAIGPFNTPAEVAGSGQEQARGYFVAGTHPRAGTLPYPLNSFDLSATPVRVTRTAPLLGEHNREVYTGQLGLNASELTTLAQLGVI